MTTSTPALLSGFRMLADRYDGFILDVWGVLHNGVEPYPGVAEALHHLGQAGKRMTLLSNGPMRASTVMERIRGIGIAPELYQQAMTSGEEVWQALKHRPDPFYAALGRRCLWWGPDRHGCMVEDLDITLIDTLEPGAFILNTGPDALDAECTAYAALMDEAAALKLPMICANPDLEVMHGPTMIYCAGQLAQKYEQRGGSVRWHGKPYRSVYESCVTLLGGMDRTRVCAVGDSLRTDVAGAAGAGIDCALVASGMHAAELGPLWREDAPEIGDVMSRLAGTQPQPTWILPGLVW